MSHSPKDANAVDAARLRRERSLALGVELMQTFLSSLVDPDKKAIRVAATATAHSLQARATIDSDYEKVSSTQVENAWLARDNQNDYEANLSPTSTPKTPVFRLTKLITSLTNSSAGSPKTPKTPNVAKNAKFRSLQALTTPTTSNVTSHALGRLNKQKSKQERSPSKNQVNFGCYPCLRRTKPANEQPSEGVSSMDAGSSEDT